MRREPRQNFPKFEESETREEFRRKINEFQSYSERTKLIGEEIADDLYIAMSTPLKKKLLASSKVNKTSWKKTNPKVIMEETERVCLPQLNLVVECQQLHQLKQEEDEDINSYESRVRVKA